MYHRALTLCACAFLSFFICAEERKVIILNKTEAAKIEPSLRKGDLAAVKIFIEASPELANAFLDMETPLTVAAYYGQLEVVKYLVQKGANVNQPDRNGTAPLVAALINANVFKFLVESGADIKLKSGRPLLMCAVEKKNKAAIELLLSKGVDVNQQANDAEQATALHIAVRHSDPERVAIAELLLKNGAKINAANADGYTPLHSAVDLGCEEQVKLLLANKANRTLKTKNGQSALELAKGRENKRIIELLSNSGSSK